MEEGFGGRVPVGRAEPRGDRADASSADVLRLPQHGGARGRRQPAGPAGPVPVQSETAALTPMAPSTARPTDVPIWRDALSTPEAAPDTPAGTSRMATCVVPGMNVPKPAPNRTYPAAVSTNGVVVVTLLNANTPAAATRHPNGDDGTGWEATVEAAGELGHQQERAVHEQPGQAGPQHRPAVHVLEEQRHVEQRAAHPEIAEQVDRRGADETARSQQRRRGHGMRGAALPPAEADEERHADGQSEQPPARSPTGAMPTRSGRASPRPGRRRWLPGRAGPAAATADCATREPRPRCPRCR